MSTTAERIIATLADYGIEDAETIEYVRGFTFLPGRSYSIAFTGPIEADDDDDAETTFEAMIEAERNMFGEAHGPGADGSLIDINHETRVISTVGEPGFRILAD